MENVIFQFKCAMFSVATNSQTIALATIITIGSVIIGIRICKTIESNKSKHKKSIEK